MFLKFLYYIWGYKTVERSKEKLRIETDLSYLESYIRGTIFLFLFGSAVLSLFLSGNNIFLFYYGASIISTFVLLFLVLKIIVLPENTLSSLLGYTIRITVDTSILGRYRASTIIVKKPRGLFQTNTYESGTDSEARNFSLHVDPKGYVDSQKLPQDNLGYRTAGHFFGLNNFLIHVRPFFILLIVICTSIFSFFPIVNIFTILLFTYTGINLIAIQWKDSGVLNKIILLAIVSCLIVNFIIALFIDFLFFQGSNF